MGSALSLKVMSTLGFLVLMLHQASAKPCDSDKLCEDCEARGQNRIHVSNHLVKHTKFVEHLKRDHHAFVERDNKSKTDFPTTCRLPPLELSGGDHGRYYENVSWKRNFDNRYKTILAYYRQQIGAYSGPDKDNVMSCFVDSIKKYNELVEYHSYERCCDNSKWVIPKSLKAGGEVHVPCCNPDFVNLHREHKQQTDDFNVQLYYCERCTTSTQAMEIVTKIRAHLSPKSSAKTSPQTRVRKALVYLMERSSHPIQLNADPVLILKRVNERLKRVNRVIYRGRTNYTVKDVDELEGICAELVRTKGDRYKLTYQGRR